MRKLFLVITFIFCAPFASAQAVRVDGVVQARSGAPAPGASVAVCSQPAVTTTQPCSPLVTLYTSSAASPACSGTLSPPPAAPGGACSNPMISDGLGNYHFYSSPGTYTIQFYGAGITPFVEYDQTLPGTLVSPTSNINNTLYVSQFAGADLGAKMNAAATNCTVTLGLPACKYIIDVSGTISTPPNFPLDSDVECTADGPTLTLATSWVWQHRGSIDFKNCVLSYNQDTSSTAFAVGKFIIGTVNTQNAATGGCTSNCVTWVSGVQFSNIDTGDLIIIANSTFNVVSKQSATVLTIAAAPGTQNGVAFSVDLARPSVGPSLSTVTVSNLKLLYSGAGTTTSTGVKVGLSEGVLFKNGPYVKGFTGLQSVGVQANGAINLSMDDAYLNSNTCQIILDQDVSGGATTPTVLARFNRTKVIAGGNCSTHVAVNLANCLACVFDQPDMEKNVTTAVIENFGSSGKDVVMHGDFEQNGDNTANAVDILFTVGVNNIAWNNRFTSLAVNLPATGINCNGATTGCIILSNEWGPISSYTTAWNFTSSAGANGIAIGNSPGAAAHGDPVNTQDVLGNFFGNTFTFGAKALLNEVAAPGGSATQDILWGDSTAHRFKMNNNNGGAKTVAVLESDNFTTPTIGGGTTITKYYVVSGAITPAQTNANTCAEQSFTPAAFNGVVNSGDNIYITSSATMAANGVFPVLGVRAVANGVDITYCNSTAGNLTAPAVTITVTGTR